MRKMVFGRKLSRGKKSREALIRSLITALVKSGKIVTTKAKAKAIQAQVDKFVTLVKKGTLASRRQAVAFLANDRKTVDFFVSKVVAQFGERKSGFTRLIRLPNRVGDMAEMARLEWTDEITMPKAEKQIKTKKAKVEKKGEKSESKVEKTKTKVVKKTRREK